MIKDLIDRLFPAKYDFYEMLYNQAKATSSGVNMLLEWLVEPSKEKSQLLLNFANQADEIRFDMETKLTEAFTTPFDRQDIYFISVQMDRVIEYGKSTFLAVEDYEVKPDEVIRNMVKALSCGMNCFTEAIRVLQHNPLKAKNNVFEMRQAQKTIDDQYFIGMTNLFKQNDTMYALKYREVYNHLKDAGLSFGYTVDSFHRIVVRVV